MRRFPLVVLLALLLAPSLALADADPLSYDDPGMHFRPPDGWTRVPADQMPGDSNGDRAPAVVYLQQKKGNDLRVIMVRIDAFTGNVDDFERAHEGELRKAHEGTFIDKREKTTLANGMPAYWLRASEGSQLGSYGRRYEWLVADGARSIVVSYTGKQGVVDEKEAKEAMASLYVVAFPRNRRS